MKRANIPTDDFTEQIAKLSPAKRALLELKLKKSGAAPSYEQTIPRRANRASAPLSFAQQRLWFLAQLDPDDSSYNIPWALRLSGALNVEALHQTLNTIVNRHESLRTTFTTVDGNPVQIIAETGMMLMPIVDLQTLSEDEREAQVRKLAIEETQRPFDLARELLMRVRLLRLDKEEHVLLLTLHHIISDAWSTGVLFRELTTLYEAYSTGRPSPLPELPIQYADYAVWQREGLRGEELDRQLSYWKGQLSGALVLEFPTDRPRPAAQSLQGEQQSLMLSKEVSEALRTLSRQEGVTLFMTLLAAFQTLLHRYTGQDDIVVGSAIANRNRAEIEGLIGFFLNTLVLRTNLSGDLTFRELLARVKEVALGAYAHQDLPFEKLVEELRPERSLGRYPLFQVMFTLTAARQALEFAGLRLSYLGLERKTSKYDLALYIIEGAEQLQAVLEYSTDLFDASTITRMLKHFQVLVESIVRNPDTALADLQIEEQLRLPSIPLNLAEQEKLPLSYHQERLWFIDQFESGHVYESSPIYHNIPLILHLTGPVDSDVLESSLNQVMNRHAALRTRIVTESDQGLQVVSSHENLQLKVVDLLGGAARASVEQVVERALDEARRPFIFDGDLLVRATLFRMSHDESVLVVTLHHIIADKRSLRLIAEELAELYRARTSGGAAQLPELALQYTHYSQWQRSLPTDVLDSLLFYWKRQLRGKLQALELPEDRPRPAVHTYTDARDTFSLSENLTRRIKALSREENSSTFALVLAGFKALLHRYARQDEIVVGTCDPCRNQAGTEKVVGPFANLLVLRSNLAGNPTFRTLLAQVRKTVDQAQAHREMPFDKLVQELKPEKDMSRTALFDVLFQFDEQELPSLDIGDAKARLIDTNLGYGKYDINLSIQGSGDGLSAAVVYNADIYDRFTIRQMMRHLEVILDAVTSNPDQQIDDVVLLSNDEEHQQLITWNSTEASYPDDQTIHQLFENQVRRTPNNTAVVYGDTQLTYRELEERANQLAHHLRDQGVRPDTLVALCLDKSADMIVALLAVLKAGGAYLPMDPAYPEERLRFMVNDSQVSHLITTSSLVSRVPEKIPSLILLDADQESIGAHSSTAPLHHTSPNNLAYCIYTSGSTGKPKGVLLEHRNVVRLMVNDKLQFSFTGTDVWTMFHSYCFDFSVWEMYGALLYGGKLVIVQEQVMKDPSLFLELLIKERVTVLNQTPTAFFNVVQETLARPQAHLALRYVIFGGEALHPIQLVEWKNAYPAVSLVNMYGITETTVHVTFKEITDKEIEENVSNIGGPIPTTTTYVVDSNLRLLPIGVAGEVCVGGGGVGRGYLGRDELTSQKFIRNPYKPEERIYRSGDLAKLLQNGEIVYLGRIDDQVQIRGFRVELGEIQSQLLKHPSVGEAEVIARKIHTDALELVAYIVTAAEVSVTTLRNHVAQTLPHHMVPSAFVMLKALPLTSNGKVDRRALPAPEQTRPEMETAFIAPRTPVEEVLAGIWVEVLGVERVGINDNFFDLGGHSLLATQVISRVRQALQVELPLRTLFEAPAVSGLAERIEAVRRAGEELLTPPMVPVSRDTVLPLSFAQQRLWFLDQIDPDSPFYNTPKAIRMEGILDEEALRQALETIVARHESLRTTFTTVDGQPTQVIAPTLSVPLPIRDLSALPESERQAEARRLAIEEARRRFDLSRGPLLRATLLRLDEEQHVLLLTLHHIISDGWSLGVLMRELTALYEAFSTGGESPLPELAIQYADFAVWQRQWMTGEVLENQLSYWKKQLGENPPVLLLPTDRPRPAVQSFEGAQQTLALSKEVSQAIKALSRREGVTLFMTLLAAFKTLLHRYTSQDDILVGSAIANRNRAEIEGLIGFFVNTLALRTDLSGDPTFRELMGRVAEVALGAYGHQDLPFERLVEELELERSLKKNPLFQVMFALQNAPGNPLQLPGLTLSPLAAGSATAKFDLTFFMFEEGEELKAVMEYSTDLFDASTITRLLGHFQTLLEGIVADPEQRLSELPLLTEKEHRQLLVEWTETQTAYPKDKCVHELFEAQVERTPDAIAVVFEDEQLTYRELNNRANQLAHYLRDLGVRPEIRVGISMERSVEMVVGLLGILKAGGAYVPLDPAYPQERLSFMLADAEVPVLLTQQHLLESLPAHSAKVVSLETEWERIAQQGAENLDSGAEAHNLVYVMYTSGSTGRPKGAALIHRNVVRLVKETNFARFDADEVFLQFAPISFDASTFELWGCLLNGARLVVFPAHTPSLQELGRALQQHGVTTLWLTAGLFHQMVDDHLEDLRGVRQLLAGGDVLSVPHVLKALGELKDCRLINGYGPTENTTFTCCYPMESSSMINGSVPIGRPISNTQVYVLDRHMNPVPVGVPGELYIGGDGLARGYLNRPELTAERFVTNRFGQEAGARLYKTGDLVRYLSDGNIEFIGRLDQQVKIRGYRIELEEIEAVLAAHPAVEQAVVLAREDVPGDKRLVAYVTQNAQYEPSTDQASVSELQAEQIAQWQVLYNETYSEGAVAQDDPTFNITGWNSSYTGEAIPATEMREWVEHTVERILSVRPRRVLEIGCGTGLLLWRVAPQCQEYLGTDFSRVALEQLQRQVEAAGLSGVKLWQREATDFTGIDAGSFDAVVINSVVQYFPSIDYLVQVLEGAVKALSAGGAIFIGDVRNYELLEAFHASVELHRAAPSLQTEQLRQRVQEQLTEENELVVAPSFFRALKEHLPQISAVEVMPKRGYADNELTRYRYDVILHVGAAVSRVHVGWLEWDRLGQNMASVRQMLEESKPEIVGFTRVANGRVVADTQILELAANQETLQTVGELREALARSTEEGVNPEEWWALGEELGYRVDLSWTGCDDAGRYDVVLRRSKSTAEESAWEAVAWPGEEKTGLRSWSYYANQPLAKTLFKSLVPQLRSYIQEKLPEYMVPSAFVMLDEMPLTPNGKVDRRALPAPERTRPELEEAFVPPRTAVEEVVAGIWSEVLDVEQVGVYDNFFDLGGHSLKATQVISRVREALQVELPLRSFFEQPTVADLTAAILENPSDQVRVEKTAQLLISLADLSEDEVAVTLDEKTLSLGGVDVK